jgi:hypothetical protein
VWGPYFGYHLSRMIGNMSYHAGLFSSYSSLQLQDGFGFRSVMENIPTDPASIFVYVLLAVSVGLIIRGSRKKGTPSSGPRS